MGNSCIAGQNGFVQSVSNVIFGTKTLPPPNADADSSSNADAKSPKQTNNTDAKSPKQSNNADAKSPKQNNNADAKSPKQSSNPDAKSPKPATSPKIFKFRKKSTKEKAAEPDDSVQTTPPQQVTIEQGESSKEHAKTKVKQEESESGKAEVKHEESKPAKAKVKHEDSKPDVKQEESKAGKAEVKHEETKPAKAKVKHEDSKPDVKQEESKAAKREVKQEESRAGKAEVKQDESKAGRVDVKQEESKAGKADVKQEESKAAKTKVKHEESKGAKPEDKHEESKGAKPEDNHEESRPAKSEVKQGEPKPAKTEVNHKESKPAKSEVKQEEHKSTKPEVKQEERKPAKPEVKQEESKPAKPEVKQKESMPAKPEVKQEESKHAKSEVRHEESKPAKPEVKHDENNPTKPEDKHEEIKPPKPEVEVKQEEVKQVKIEAKEESKPTTAEHSKSKKHMRRVSSVGLQVDSVLQRKSGNLKDDYSIGRKLGEGQFGTTHFCLDKKTGKEVACKSIAKRKLITREDVEDVRREIQIMHHLAGHPNVISIIAAYEDAVAVHMVMELCAGGELFDRIVQRGHYSERKAAELARVIVGVVEACHSLGVMHRDLKPENFLFVNEEEDAPLKTIDFGLSVFFKPGDTFIDVVGSPYYVAPEVLRKFYGQECDVWSAGVIIYILLSGVPPFWDENEHGIFEQVLRGELDFESEPWPSISEDAKDLVKRMLVRDPKKRLTAHEVLSHPWVKVHGVAPDKPLDSAVLSRLKQFSAMHKLKKIAIRIIAEHLSEDEIAGLKEMFKMIDSDNSGHITLEELTIGLERVGANLMESEISQLMKAADLDNSGTIDYTEFVAAMLHQNKTVREDHVFAAFSYFDKDGSGYITPDELQQVCEQFGFGDVHLEEIMNEVDQDRDGRIDYNEFVAMMQNTEFGKKAMQNSASIALKDAFKNCS